MHWRAIERESAEATLLLRMERLKQGGSGPGFQGQGFQPGPGPFGGSRGRNPGGLGPKDLIELSAWVPSSIDPHLVFGIGDGCLYRSTDGGRTWKESPGAGSIRNGFDGAAILPSSIERDTCWVAGHGLAHPPVHVSRDGGRTWRAESAGLLSTRVHCLAEAPDRSGRIFCGTEDGAWAFDPETACWRDILGAEAPPTAYLACEVVPSRNLIRFVTRDHGIWEYRFGTPEFFSYGESRGGANVLALSRARPTWPGRTMVLRVTGCRRGAPGILGVSLGRAERDFAGGTLLLALDRCTLIPFAADQAGVGRVHLTLSAASTLEGRDIHLQAGAIDDGQARGIALSQGLRVRTGE